MLNPSFSRSNRSFIKSVIVCFICAFITFTAVSQQPTSPLETSFTSFRAMKEHSDFKLDWISLGPTLNSARADVVQVDATHPGTMYVGFGSGGLWKTTNHGLSWKSVFNDKPTPGIGDVALAPSDPRIIYLGTGENLKKPRNFTLPGTGMYRSKDAGETWDPIGLQDSWSIAEITVHPTNPDIVFVCVLGHLWSKNKNRGLYKSSNGGQTWEHVLFKDDKTGANAVVISPLDPKIMYASLWEVYPGISGKNSGVYRSNDGGDSWVLCTKGLPSGPKIGRIGLTVSATNPLKAYALIDNLNNSSDTAAELYKTVDGGLNWSKTHDQAFKIFPGIGWYFTDVYVNPQNDEEVFCLGVRLAHSIDGGKSFEFIGGQVTHMTPSLAQGLHLDQCELWIDPENPDHLALGNDGGFYVSYDKGASWMHYNNIPTGEFYDITIDQSNYVIYGGTQDDATVYGPPKELNTNFPDTWKYLWIDPWDGGDGCVSQVDPKDPTIAYYSMQHGHAMRLDRKKDIAVSIEPTLPKALYDSLKFNYITPYFISPFESKTLYHGGNYIFKSVNRGDTWNVISPNLANSSIKAKESFATGALIESPIEKGVLYAGTDKGAFWVSKNDGGSWEEHSAGLANNYIRSICASRFKPERVYLAMTGINYDDLHSYLYVSEDNGKNWKNISNGLPDEPINVVLEDPTNENILYSGGLRGVYVSIDRGANWSYLGQDMPNVAIADLEIQEATMDLVVATHGRGIYKTNLRPLQKMFEQKLATDQDYFFDIARMTRPWFNSAGGEPDYRTLEKSVFTLWLNEPKKITLTLRDTSNNELWKCTLDGHKGFNQYRWDLILQKLKSDYPYFVHYDTFIKAGAYIMTATLGDLSYKRPFEVQKGISPYKMK